MEGVHRFYASVKRGDCIYRYVCLRTELQDRSPHTLRISHLISKVVIHSQAFGGLNRVGVNNPNHVGWRKNCGHQLDRPFSIIVGNAIDALAAQQFLAVTSVTYVRQAEGYAHRVRVDNLDSIKGVISSSNNVSIVIGEPLWILCHVHRSWRMRHWFVRRWNNDGLGCFITGEGKVQCLPHLSKITPAQCGEICCQHFNALGHGVFVCQRKTTIEQSVRCEPWRRLGILCASLRRSCCRLTERRSQSRGAYQSGCSGALYKVTPIRTGIDFCCAFFCVVWTIAHTWSPWISSATQ